MKPPFAMTRAYGLLCARMGACLLQIADADEAGDGEASARHAKEIIRLIAAVAEVGLRDGADADGAIASQLADTSREIAEEYLPHEPVALNPTEIDRLLRGTD